MGEFTPLYDVSLRSANCQPGAASVRCVVDSRKTLLILEDSLNRVSVYSLCGADKLSQIYVNLLKPTSA
jgi:hypothetical protein